MSNLNICSFICKDADPQKQIIENIINEIELPTKEKVHLHVMTFLNGIGTNDKHIYLDYYISHISNIDDRRKYLCLFALDFYPDNEEVVKSNRESQYENYIFEISYDEIDVSFPYKGTYELEVFKLDEAPTGSMQERYKKYQNQNKVPDSVYNFVVK